VLSINDSAPSWRQYSASLPLSSAVSQFVAFDLSPQQLLGPGAAPAGLLQDRSGRVDVLLKGLARTHGRSTE
jgi:hypothetical protein